MQIGSIMSKKTLMAMRHAKSSWDHIGLDDHDRPLNERGLRDAPRMAEWLQNHDLVPERIISSTAVRAITTAEILAEHLKPTPTVVPHRDLYLADPEEYYQALRLLGDPCERVMVVGHNPGLEELVEQLSGEFHRMPTAAIAVFDVAIREWAQFDPLAFDQLNLRCVVRPKELD